jgi:hypothetical protein
VHFGYCGCCHNAVAVLLMLPTVAVAIAVTIALALAALLPLLSTLFQFANAGVVHFCYCGCCRHAVDVLCRSCHPFLLSWLLSSQRWLSIVWMQSHGNVIRKVKRIHTY